MSAGGNDPVRRITRITVRYVPEEDRILLAVAYGEAQKGRLWLVRPLADRLVTALTRQLAQPAGTTPDKSSAAQVYAQLQARLAKRPSPSVQPDTEAPQALITELRLSRGKAGAWRVVCMCRDTEPAVLLLATEELRQWLEALHQAYLMARWPTQVWPDWFRPAMARRKQ